MAENMDWLKRFNNDNNSGEGRRIAFMFSQMMQVMKERGCTHNDLATLLSKTWPMLARQGSMFVFGPRDVKEQTVKNTAVIFQQIFSGAQCVSEDKSELATLINKENMNQKQRRGHEDVK